MATIESTGGVAPHFETSGIGPEAPAVYSLFGLNGESVRLETNQYGLGYRLLASDGIGPAPIEHTSAPRARGGATLQHSRQAEGTMYFVIEVNAGSGRELQRMISRLTNILIPDTESFTNPRDGGATFTVWDPTTYDARFRRVYYVDGLQTEEWSGPLTKTFGITVEYFEPFWLGPVRTEEEKIAPPKKPLITADEGTPINRWPDPGLEAESAYAPWVVWDGGIEKSGTGERHGTEGMEIDVTPGETVTISVDISRVSGPEVGDVSVRVVPVSTGGMVIGQNVIQESYPGTYVGRYEVPSWFDKIMVGFYTEEDVYSTSRVRIENIVVQREIQYSATYEWEGTPHASPSNKRDDEGEIVARNLVPSPRRIDDSYSTSNVEVDSSDGHSLNLVTTTGGGTSYTGMTRFEVEPGQWFGSALSYEWGQGVGRVHHQVQFRAADNTSVDAPQEQSDRSDHPDGGRSITAWEVPDGATEARLYSWYYLEGTFTIAPEGSTIYIGEYSVAVADSEADALAQVEEYFDGDTPDEVDQGSIEGARTVPFFPVLVSDSNVQGKHEIMIEGDAPVWPKWTIIGPGENVRITGPCGRNIYITGEVHTPITIETAPGRIAIRDETGLIWDRMTPGNDEVFPLRPGLNTVQVSMSGGSPASRILCEYRENWLGPRGVSRRRDPQK